MLGHVDMLLRIGLGAGLGGVIGFERDVHKRPIGLRTHTIVALTAATFMVVSAQFVHLQRYEAGGLVDVDGSRIAASVVSAVGFLAGGAILRSGGTVQGVTTAAGLWMVTAIGLAAGAGMFVEAVGATLLGVFALTVLRRFEDKDDAILRRRVSLVLVAQDPAPVLAALAEIGVTVHGVSYERRYDDKARVELSFDARIPKKVGVEKVLDAIEATAEVRRLRIDVPG